MNPTPTSFPNFVAHNAVEAEQIQLLHQIQQHTLTAKQAYLFMVSWAFPVAPAIKMQIYHFLLSLPIPELSPLGLTLVLLLTPVFELLALGILGLIIYLLFKLIQLTIILIARLFVAEGEKLFLEVTFPVSTKKSSYATEQLYKLFHSLSRQSTFLERLAKRKRTYSLEIVSTKEDGIRYVAVIPEEDEDTVKKSLYAYLPGVKIRKMEDYLENVEGVVSVLELELNSHFVLPLNSQKALEENDPISYLTGIMTKLKSSELITYQLVLTPVLSSAHSKITKELGRIEKRIYNGEPLTQELKSNIFRTITTLPIISIVWVAVKIAWTIFYAVLSFIFRIILGFATISAKVMPFPDVNFPRIPSEMLSPYEKELKEVVKDKISQPLFEVSIRALVYAKNKKEVTSRMSGILSSFGQFSTPYQSLVAKNGNLSTQLANFKRRSISNSVFSSSPILSVSEVSDLYHFPYTGTTKTEGLVKVYSKDLSAPLSLKNARNLDVIFGKNTYGGEDVEIGLTDDERSRHVYLIGQTGSGKSTVMFHMAKDDIQKGRGVAVVDPHGDLIEDLIATVPEERMEDFIYFNPFDLKYPVGINLLELHPTRDEDELELEKELVAESVVSIFRRIFSNEEQSNAHRIEYILRNTVYTAFYVEDRTIFTIYSLLNDPTFRKQVIAKVNDENLQNFWKNEFNKAGNYQIVKMVSGVTAKVGRFLFSPTAKRILQQTKSTVNFDDILENGKILLCNLSEGKLGEDTSQLLGTTIITKLQQAAYRRVRKDKKDRKPFYLFIDEFQNFATSSFTKLLSGGRKFGIRVTIAEQSTAQQKDGDVTNVILANTGTVLCFKTASMVDEELLLPQFSPYVAKGEIMNLPRYHFYIKLGALEPEEPFSGKTLSTETNRDKAIIDKLISSSRKNYATVYVKKETQKTLPRESAKEKLAQRSAQNSDKNIGAK